MSGDPMRAFVTCDGEASQVRVFQENEMIKLFKDNLIDFAKTPASCSGICQASDVSKFFPTTKKAMKVAVHRDEWSYDTRLARNTRKALDNIRYYYIHAYNINIL